MSISILIPTFNGEQSLRELLPALREQSVQPDEILVVDSSSTDGTVQLCLDYGAKVNVIPQQQFDHGGTRTAMARQAAGDIVVFLTQDAIPSTRHALEKLLQPFTVEPQLAMTYGRQLPNADADFAASHLRTFNYPEQSAIRRYSDREKLGIRAIFTSNSFAAYRKTTLAEVGYFKDGLIFGEDTCAAGRLLQRGYLLQYVSEAAVYHSHNYRLSQEFKRSFDIGVLHSTESQLFEDFGRAENRGVDYVKSGMALLLGDRRYLQAADFLLRSVTKLVGYKAGKNYRKLPGSLVTGLSMHQSWWYKEKEIQAKGLIINNE